MGLESDVFKVLTERSRLTHAGHLSALRTPPAARVSEQWQEIAGIRRTTGTLGGAIGVLSVSPIEEDHLSLYKILEGPIWVLHSAKGVAQALLTLDRRDIGVVLCERDLHLHTWRDMLYQLAASQDSPPLIVTAWLPDERLWAEALNLGAYDVLAKPFERQEVIRAVYSAWLHGLGGPDVAAG